MKLAVISFTKAGSKVNAKLIRELKSSHQCTGYYKGRCWEELELIEVKESLSEWCKERFHQLDGLIFIGACAIAVRTIAPYLEDKTKDPFVLVIDEQGKFVISLLSGHIGGGNEMSQQIAIRLNATPIITTATDINQKFAVDVFATKEKLHILDMPMAKEVSASLLDGNSIGFLSEIEVVGAVPDVTSNGRLNEVPQMKVNSVEVNREESNNSLELETKQKLEVGICISFDEEKKPFLHTLTLIPKRIILGVGCKKNTDSKQFEEYILQVLRDNRISIHSILHMASIDLKEKEPCILEFARKYNLSFLTYTASELQAVEGEFEESDFVKKTTGVGNVCERSALKSCEAGTILLKKQSRSGVTVALAREMRGIQFE
jgi:cobalt-precorrin 5A hydrolase